MKHILITEEQLNKVLIDEATNITAQNSDFVEGLILTIITAEIRSNVLKRLFHPEVIKND